MKNFSILKTHIDAFCKTPRIPGSQGHQQAQEYLRSQIRSLGLHINEDSFRVSQLKNCKNLWVETDPQFKGPRLLLGAHYDSYHRSGPAADDNASGLAVILETLRGALEAGAPPLTFCFFDMEEPYRFRVLSGSKYFAPRYPLPLSGVVILDLVGGCLAPGFENSFLQFGNLTSSLQHPELEFLYLPQSFVEPLGSWGARSDYHAFRKRGTRFTFLTSGTPWYYHTTCDQPDRLLYPKMQALTETLIHLCKSNRSAELSQGLESDALKFLEKIQRIPELDSPLIRKILSKKRGPNRLEIMRLYAHILPKLRKLKDGLWHL